MSAKKRKTPAVTASASASYDGRQCVYCFSTSICDKCEMCYACSAVHPKYACKDNHVHTHHTACKQPSDAPAAASASASSNGGCFHCFNTVFNPSGICANCSEVYGNQSCKDKHASSSSSSGIRQCMWCSKITKSDDHKTCDACSAVYCNQSCKDLHVPTHETACEQYNAAFDKKASAESFASKYTVEPAVDDWKLTAAVRAAFASQKALLARLSPECDVLVLRSTRGFCAGEKDTLERIASNLKLMDMSWKETHRSILVSRGVNTTDLDPVSDYIVRAK